MPLFSITSFLIVSVEQVIFKTEHINHINVHHSNVSLLPPNSKGKNSYFYNKGC